MEKQKESLVTLRFAIIIETFKEEKKNKFIPKNQEAQRTTIISDMNESDFSLQS